MIRNPEAVHSSDSLPARSSGAIRWHRVTPRVLAGLLVTAQFVGPLAPSASAQTASSSTSSTTSTSTTSTTTTTTTTLPTTTSTSTTTSTTVPTTTSTTTSTTSTTIAPNAPSVPRSLAVALTGTAQVTITWVAPEKSGSQPISAYKLVVLTIVGNTSTTSAPITIAPNVSSYVLNDLRPGVAYAFYLRAENAAGAGPNTAFTAPIIVPGPTTSAPAAPASPTNPAMTLINGQLRVTWTPPTSTPTQIVRYRVATIPSIGSVTVDASILGATFASPRAGTTYLAQIFAVGINGKESPAATTNSVAIPVAPVAPPTAVPPTPLPGSGLPLPGQAPTPPGTPKPCVKVSWPKYVYGRPTTFTTGAPQGVYMWHDGKYWQVKVYNPGPGQVTFTGFISANAKVTFSSYGVERGDSVRRYSKSARFSLKSNYDIDSIRVSASCATALRFNFAINGVPVAPNRIFIGPLGIASTSDFTIVR